MSLLLLRKYIAIKLWDIPFTWRILNLSLLCESAIFFDFKKTNIFFECCEQVSFTAICEKSIRKEL